MHISSYMRPGNGGFFGAGTVRTGDVYENRRRQGSSVLPDMRKTHIAGDVQGGRDWNARPRILPGIEAITEKRSSFHPEIQQQIIAAAEGLLKLRLRS
jgi:hypothetical protein